LRSGTSQATVLTLIQSQKCLELHEEPAQEEEGVHFPQGDAGGVDQEHALGLLQEAEQFHAQEEMEGHPGQVCHDKVLKSCI